MRRLFFSCQVTMVGSAENIPEFGRSCIYIYLWMNFGKVALPGAVDYEWTSRDRISRWNTAIHIPEHGRPCRLPTPHTTPSRSFSFLCLVVRPLDMSVSLFVWHATPAEINYSIHFIYVESIRTKIHSCTCSFIVDITRGAVSRGCP